MSESQHDLEQISARPAPGIRAGLAIVPRRNDGKPIHHGIRPLGDRILVYPCIIELDEDRSGILQADISEDRADSGVVVATGQDCKLLRVGDLIWFGKYTGSYVADEKLVIMREQDVIAVVDEYLRVRRREEKGQEVRLAVAGGLEQFQRGIIKR